MADDSLVPTGGFQSPRELLTLELIRVENAIDSLRRAAQAAGRRAQAAASRVRKLEPSAIDVDSAVSVTGCLVAILFGPVAHLMYWSYKSLQACRSHTAAYGDALADKQAALAMRANVIRELRRLRVRRLLLRLLRNSKGTVPGIVGGVGPFPLTALALMVLGAACVAASRMQPLGGILAAVVSVISSFVVYGCALVPFRRLMDRFPVCPRPASVFGGTRAYPLVCVLLGVVASLPFTLIVTEAYGRFAAPLKQRIGDAADGPTRSQRADQDLEEEPPAGVPSLHEPMSLPNAAVPQRREAGASPRLPLDASRPGREGP